MVEKSFSINKVAFHARGRCSKLRSTARSRRQTRLGMGVRRSSVGVCTRVRHAASRRCRSPAAEQDATVKPDALSRSSAGRARTRNKAERSEDGCVRGVRKAKDHWREDCLWPNPAVQIKTQRSRDRRLARKQDRPRSTQVRRFSSQSFQ